jgi:hypothetical protein
LTRKSLIGTNQYFRGWIGYRAGGYLGYRQLTKPTPQQVVENSVVFDSSFSELEKQKVSDAIINQTKNVKGITTAQIQTVEAPVIGAITIDGYVPITHVYSPKQQITKLELATSAVSIWHEIDPTARTAISNTLGLNEANLQILNNIEDLGQDEIAIIPVGQLSKDIKLLSYEGTYYLDNFAGGAVFRQVSFTGDSAQEFSDLKLNTLPSKDTTFKVNQSGVTALTRVMMRKLDTVGDPLYFSEKIGDFLADADLTHVSNEVSFKEGCGFSNTLFCSDPRFIETLKDSGVDLVEITGNHNNDVGSQFNTDTINQYRALGWSVVGGGLNTEDARKFFVTNQKDSKIAILAYNYPDSPNGGAISRESSAGANSFDFDRIKEDIDSAKLQANFVIVDVQYWECYAYPDGYVEFPQCDKPIGEQEAVFKRLVDLGADMVVGSSAHQPQTYEMYNGKPIYYGLGNMYFDQTQWPGTERGIILSHYFAKGVLIQTKLSPTVYGDSLQTELASDAEALYLLGRLNEAR